VIQYQPHYPPAPAAAVSYYRLAGTLFVKIILPYPLLGAAPGAAGELDEFPASGAFESHGLFLVAQGGPVHPGFAFAIRTGDV